MRITFLTPSANLSGGCRIIAEHARMLHARGHQVTVVVGGQHKPSMRSMLKAFLRGRWITRSTTNATHFDLAPYTVCEIESSRPIQTEDVPDGDIIIATWWETAEWVWPMPDEKGVKVNFIQHHEVHSWLPVDRVHAVWKMPMTKVVVSRWLQDIAKDQYYDPSAILVSNGLDTDHFKFVDRSPSGSMIIGAMYSGMKKLNFKRFWLAVETVQALQLRGIECKFIGFGTKPAPEGELPPGSEFEVAPSQDRIAEIYASCDCWLFTSDKEGYGLPLLESMACGTPVVATPAGAAPELLESGGGVLVDSSDPEDLADAVQRVLELPDDEWRAMSRKARAEAEKHSWDVIGDQMEAALMKILADARAVESESGGD